MYTQFLRRVLTPLAVLWLLSPLAAAQEVPIPPVPPAPLNPGVPPSPAVPANLATPLVKPSILFKVQNQEDRLEMIVHTSRILTMDQKIAHTQIGGNPDVLDLTPLSPNHVQISAKATGVTQVNLWDESKRLYTINVLVTPDAQELQMILRTTFPTSPLKVTPLASSVMISGYVDKNEYIDRIIQIAEQYYPKVINNMTVAGVQQIMLHVKVMEVSRTKLRELGFDWASITGANSVMSGVSGMVLPPSSPLILSGVGSTPPAVATTANNPINGTMAFNIANGNNAFFGVLQALRQDNLLKVAAEPTLTTNNGRPAKFESGGTFFIPVPQSLGTISAQAYEYGTSIYFVPIVLGNGKIRLEVKPSVSELDYSNATVIAGSSVPGTRTRSVDTQVELMAGQTLAIAGLVQSRTESSLRGIPLLCDIPIVGMAFRKTHELKNEVELLILVTPELVEPLDAHEVPPCGPGMETTSPSDWQLHVEGHLEVPVCPPRDAQNGGGNGGCSTCGNAGSPPPDGMLGPSEQVPSPPAAREPRPTQPQNRYAPANPNSAAAAPSRTGPPGFIGPVGYDVVK